MRRCLAAELWSIVDRIDGQKLPTCACGAREASGGRDWSVLRRIRTVPLFDGRKNPSLLRVKTSRTRRRSGERVSFIALDAGCEQCALPRQRISPTHAKLRSAAGATTTNRVSESISKKKNSAQRNGHHRSHARKWRRAGTSAAVTDLTQDSDDEPPAKRAKAATPDLAQLRTRGAPRRAGARAGGRARRRSGGAVASEGLALPAIPFYGHTHGAYTCFSNFFASPFDFALPACCSAAPRTLRVAFGEQAIMACKAAAMGDWASYDKISRSNTSPKACKALGRKVKPFRQDVWAGVVVEVAVEIATQKFASDPALWKVLDGTGDRVLAEMTKNDSYWGTGIDRSHADAQTPSAWPGTNILGYALMVARERLRARRAGSAPASSAPASSPPRWTMMTTTTTTTTPRRPDARAQGRRRI